MTGLEVAELEEEEQAGFDGGYLLQGRLLPKREREILKSLFGREARDPVEDFDLLVFQNP